MHDFIPGGAGCETVCPVESDSACCHDGGGNFGLICTDMSLDNCDTWGGSWHPGSNCSYTPYGYRCGSCCDSGNSCEDWTVEDDCDYVYSSNEVCENSCTLSTEGACCAADSGDCYMTSYEECVAQGGQAWHGEGTPCDPDPCNPDEAFHCCFGCICWNHNSGAPGSENELACLEHHGTWQEGPCLDQYTCNPPGTCGSCCVEWAGIGGRCSHDWFDAQYCEGFLGGQYQGDGTDCYDNEQGLCFDGLEPGGLGCKCYHCCSDAGCDDEVWSIPELCDDEGYDYYEDCVDCGERGACCYEFNCVANTLMSECLSNGGVYQGKDVDCGNGDQCGACCEPSGQCEEYQTQCPHDWFPTERCADACPGVLRGACCNNGQGGWGNFCFIADTFDQCEALGGRFFSTDSPVVDCGSTGYCGACCSNGIICDDYVAEEYCQGSGLEWFSNEECWAIPCPDAGESGSCCYFRSDFMQWQCTDVPEDSATCIQLCVDNNNYDQCCWNIGESCDTVDPATGNCCFGNCGCAG